MNGIAFRRVASVGHAAGLSALEADGGEAVWVADMNNFAGSLAELLGVVDDVVDCSWDSAERGIGRPLPGDFKEFVGHTGSVVLDDRLTVFAPNSSRDVDIAALVQERDSAWEHLRDGGVDLPGQYFAEGRRLIAFAAVDAAYFFWDSRDGVAPEEWGVVIVDGDVQNWYEFEASATEVLYRTLVAEIDIPPFRGLFGRSEHDVGVSGPEGEQPISGGHAPVRSSPPRSGSCTGLRDRIVDIRFARRLRD